MKKNNTNSWLVWAGEALIFIAIILILLFFMQGSTTISGEFPDLEKTESLSCTAENIDYPTFVYDNSKRKTTKIDAVFKDGKLQSISLVHTLYYDNNKEIIDSEALNHAAVNIDSKAADIFDAHYSKFDDAMSMTMYTEYQNLNNSNKKYMMLNLVSINDLDFESVKQNYETQEFICRVDNIS